MRYQVITAVLLAGCTATSPANYAGRSAYRDTLIKRYESGVYPEQAYLNKFARNQLLNELVTLVNENYAEYERTLYSNTAWANTAADLAILGLSSAATVAGGEGVKTALAATITGLSGAQMAVTKEFFAEQSRIAIIAKMRALRIDKLTEIEVSKTKTIQNYPLSRALIDVQQLAEAGTVVSGLQGLVQQSSESLSRAQENLMRVTKGEE